MKTTIYEWRVLYVKGIKTTLVYYVINDTAITMLVEEAEVC